MIPKVDLRFLSRTRFPWAYGYGRYGYGYGYYGSDSKSGKSFLLMELCISIAEGSKWLGFPCRQGKVLYVNLEIDPASCVLHYAQMMFEGMKAYRTEKGNIQLFRPMDNIDRFNNSGVKLCIPHIPEEDWTDAHHWIIFHGRRVCAAQRPKCAECALNQVCDFYTRKDS